MPERARPPVGEVTLAPQGTGGPDDYGYTWDDSVGMNWIDATHGTDTGMSGGSWDQAVGPISLPFSFNYYENTYTSLYIAASGYLAFTEADYWSSQTSIPSPRTPNNVIAPYWSPLSLATSGSTNRVYYRSGGDAPNRYFVAEWYRVRNDDEVYTFEVVLHENGDITFQYQAMTYTGGYPCGSAGIEDSAGLDGLTYLELCDRAPSNKAVRFYRPAPSARVSIRPLHQGRFTYADQTETFEIPIHNTGELGADTYDVTTSSTWPVSLYKADGVTPLSDTDGDGTVDTGSVAQGETTTIVAKVTTPDAVNLGDANTAAVTVRSSVDTSQSKTASLKTSVPAPFAQVFKDDADGEMSLYLAQPGGQSLKKTTAYYHDGSYMAVAEMPDSFAYVWQKSRNVNGMYVGEIEYTLLDSDGNTTLGVTKLTNHSSATSYIYDYPVVAVAPNGRIGVLWSRQRYNPNNYSYNYNIFFAILDSAGNRVYGPVNLTNNSAWGTYFNVPNFDDPRIAATGDNRFVLAWWRRDDGDLTDIYYAVRDANGNAVKGVTKFTNSAMGDAYYYDPALARLSGNRALLAYRAYRGSENIYYAVLNSAGNTVKGETPTGGYGYRPDAVQLSDDSVLLAWTAEDQIEFAMLDGTTYNVTTGPRALDNPAAPTGDDYVSVTADGAGHGILTWMDADYDYRRNLYYALVDSDGTVLNAPMVFRTSQAMDPDIETSYMGYGNTSWTGDFIPPTSKAKSPEFATEAPVVSWSGTDEGSGIDSYDVQVRDGADGEWTDWLTDTTAISATYTAVESGHTYYFRSVAYDQAGNVETDLSEDGDTHTTVADYQVEGRVTNNRGQPVFNATVSAEPGALNTATTNTTGDYALYFESGGMYTLTVERSGFGALPPMYDLLVDDHLTGVDLVLPPENEAVINGGWETGDLSGWNSGPGVTPTVEMTATHTGLYGLAVEASGGTVSFWPYVTQTLSIPSTWARPTLSFLYRKVADGADDALQAVISGGGEVITHTVPLTLTSWTHIWHDLSIFSGQTVTLRFGFEEQTPGQQVYLDEVSVGETEAGVVAVYLPLVIRNR